MTISLVAIAAQIAVSLFLLLWTRARVRAALNSGEEIERIRREISALLIELDASADRNVTVIEDRIAALKDAIGEADKRLAAMAREGSKRSVESAVYDRLGRLRRDASAVAPVAAPQALDYRLGAYAEPPQAGPSGFATAGAPPPDARPRPDAIPPAAPAAPPSGAAGASPPASPSAPRAAPTAAPTAAVEPAGGAPIGPLAGEALPFVRFSDRPVDIEEPFAEKAAALARKGFSSDIIAARLGATITEVDLALSTIEDRRGRSEGN